MRWPASRKACSVASASGNGSRWRKIDGRSSVAWAHRQNACMSANPPSSWRLSHETTISGFSSLPNSAMCSCIHPALKSHTTPSRSIPSRIWPESYQPLDVTPSYPYRRPSELRRRLRPVRTRRACCRTRHDSAVVLASSSPRRRELLALLGRRVRRRRARRRRDTAARRDAARTRRAARRRQGAAVAAVPPGRRRDRRRHGRRGRRRDLRQAGRRRRRPADAAGAERADPRRPHRRGRRRRWRASQRRRRRAT